MKILMLSLILGLLTGQSLADDYSIREVMDIARRAPEVPTDNSEMSIREAVDRGRSMSYEIGIAQGTYQTTTPNYSIREAVDLYGYRAPFPYPFPYPQYAPAAVYPVVYAPYNAPYYYASPRLLYPASELFGTPPPPTPEPTLTPEPTPRERGEPEVAPASTPAPTPAQETRPTQPVILAGVGLAAPTMRTVPVQDEPTLIEAAAYLGRKLFLSVILIAIGAWALYKDHTAKHQTSRRIADLEEDMQRLDRLIYGKESKKL